MHKRLLNSFYLLFGFLFLTGEEIKRTRGWAWFDVAYAARNLAPTDFDLQTIAGRADFARYLYFMVNGPTSGYTISGPADGYTWMINNITAGIGKRLESDGIKGCQNIPLKGTSGTTIQTKDGTVGVTMTFTTASKTIPSHFGKYGGEAYDRRIEVSKLGEPFMAVELRCDEDPNIRTGYILTSGSELSQRNFEIYFQYNLNTKSGFVDLMQISSNSDQEKVVVRFLTGDGDSYEMWLIRTAKSESSGLQGAYFGLKGSAAAKKAQLNAIHVEGSLDDASAISSAAHKDCIDFSKDVAVSGTGCSEVKDPSGEIKFNGTDLSWTIAGVAAASISNL